MGVYCPRLLGGICNDLRGGISIVPFPSLEFGIVTLVVGWVPVILVLVQILAGVVGID